MDRVFIYYQINVFFVLSFSHKILVLSTRDMYGGPPYNKEMSAAGKTVIITGAASGIGKEAAWEFAKRGAKVFMACRDMSACEVARKEVVLETQNNFKSEEPRVHILINNAAVMEPPQGVTRDGFETQLGVNHMGHFLLTQLLLDTIVVSDVAAFPFHA
ncbi:unnamed protein product [Leptidea sinapis]|uniref:Uncharacterized protein n=1 Tax=Leptidea sinapis TaxID=189913 RepID=A0A5E4R207_9NEOP|nr:unnamed protein product [Leptidea sinapis]